MHELHGQIISIMKKAFLPKLQCQECLLLHIMVIRYLVCYSTKQWILRIALLSVLICIVLRLQTWMNRPLKSNFDSYELGGICNRRRWKYYSQIVRVNWQNMESWGKVFWCNNWPEVCRSHFLKSQNNI